MIAFIEAKRAGLFSKDNIWQNIIAGIIVGIVALPLSMAFAIASGAAPQQGLYTGIVAALCISLFGGSRVQIGGPTGAFIVILAGITADYGIAGLQVASLMAGCMLILLGILHLGAVIKYIPKSVIIGFTTGIAIIIFVGQWKYFLGLPIDTSHRPFSQQLFVMIKNFHLLDFHTTLLGAISLFILISWPKFLKKIPAPLVAMVVATALQGIFKFDTVATLGSTFGAFPKGFPHPHFPSISFNEVISLILPAFTIAMLGSIESLLSAVVADAMAGTKHNSNQELIGQGVANILSPIFGGFAATGAIARTATNIRNGGNSPIAGITHSIVLILIILFLAPYAANIPLTCLSAILFVVAYNMSEWRKFALLCRQSPYYDIIVLLLTFFLTIFVNLVVAVNIGVILAALLFMHSMSKAFIIEKKCTTSINEPNIAPTKKSITFTLNGPLFFGVITNLQETLHNIHDEATEIIFNLKFVPFIDGTGLIMLQDSVETLHKHHITVHFIGMNHRVEAKLKKSKLIS